MKLSSIVPLALFFLLGCQNPGDSSSSAKRPTTVQIDIFRGGQVPSKGFREIGTLVDEAREVEEGEVEGKMIKKAKRMGGNAIIFEPKKPSGQEFTAFFTTLSQTFLYKARVIVYE